MKNIESNPLFRTRPASIVSATSPATATQATTAATLAAMMDNHPDEDTRRNARWCWRWLMNYTDKTNETARRNATAAAQRLGITIQE